MVTMEASQSYLGVHLIVYIVCISRAVHRYNVLHCGSNSAYGTVRILLNFETMIDASQTETVPFVYISMQQKDPCPG